MLETRLLLIRHGHCAHTEDPDRFRLIGWTDVPLSSAGRAQADRLRTRLLSEPAPAAIYVSPLRRAWQTAHLLKAACPGPFITLPELKEIYCGEVDGSSVDEVKSTYPNHWAQNEDQRDEQFRWPHGESYFEFRKRVLRGIHTIAHAHPGERVVVVTHCGVISQIMGYLAHVSAAAWGKFRAQNGSITEVLWKGESGRVLSFNDVTHLAVA